MNLSETLFVIPNFAYWCLIFVGDILSNIVGVKMIAYLYGKEHRMNSIKTISLGVVMSVFNIVLLNGFIAKYLNGLPFTIVKIIISILIVVIVAVVFEAKTKKDYIYIVLAYYLVHLLTVFIHGIATIASIDITPLAYIQLSLEIPGIYESILMIVVYLVVKKMNLNRFVDKIAKYQGLSIVVIHVGIINSFLMNKLIEVLVNKRLNMVEGLSQPYVIEPGVSFWLLLIVGVNMVLGIILFFVYKKERRRSSMS